MTTELNAVTTGPSSSSAMGTETRVGRRPAVIVAKVILPLLQLGVGVLIAASTFSMYASLPFVAVITALTALGLTIAAALELVGALTSTF